MASLSATGEGQITGTGAAPARHRCRGDPFLFSLKVNGSLDYAA